MSGKISVDRPTLCDSLTTSHTYVPFLMQKKNIPIQPFTVLLLEQWFSNVFLGTHSSAHFACLPYLTHSFEFMERFLNELMI